MTNIPSCGNDIIVFIGDGAQHFHKLKNDSWQQILTYTFLYKTNSFPIQMFTFFLQPYRTMSITYSANSAISSLPIISSRFSFGGAKPTFQEVPGSNLGAVDNVSVHK